MRRHRNTIPVGVIVAGAVATIAAAFSVIGLMNNNCCSKIKKKAKRALKTASNYIDGIM